MFAWTFFSHNAGYYHLAKYWPFLLSYSVYTPNHPVCTRNLPVYTPNHPIYTRNHFVYTPNRPIYTRNRPIYPRNHPVYTSNHPIHNRNHSVYTPNHPIHTRNNSACTLNHPIYILEITPHILRIALYILEIILYILGTRHRKVRYIGTSREVYRLPLTYAQRTPHCGTPSWEANRSSAIHEFLEFYATRKFVTTLTRSVCRF
jgi:hypothetical protein